jgi:hypothetical protein
MPLVGFEPAIPAFERAKTVHVLDCADSVIGSLDTPVPYYPMQRKTLCGEDLYASPKLDNLETYIL